MLKKNLFSFIVLGLLTFSFLVILPAYKASQATAVLTLVSGIIKDTGGTPVGGAMVTIICHHGGTDHTKFDVSRMVPADEVGFYQVLFPVTKCTFGDTITVHASKDDMNGSNSGTVSGGDININVAIISVTVPEFGLITGAFALFASAGTFLALKRRTA